jgi:hypothetical protein
VFHRVGDAGGRALRDAHQCEGFAQVGRVDDGFQVAQPMVQGEPTRVAAGHAAAAFVVAEQAVVLAEEPVPVAPDRAFQVVFQVAQPVGRLDQHRPAAERGPRQARAVAGGQVADRLLHAAVPEGNRSAV